MPASIISLILWFAFCAAIIRIAIVFERLIARIGTDAPMIYGDVPHLPSSLRLHNDGGL